MKKVAFSYYFHRSNICEIASVLTYEQKDLLSKVLKEAVKHGIKADIIKFNTKTNNISLIKCETFDTLNEPIVGDSYCFHPDLSFKVIKSTDKVYHNKWQFVTPDYTGFDYEKAKERTEEWNKIPNIKQHKSRIGNKEYWYQLLKENGLEI